MLARSNWEGKGQRGTGLSFRLTSICLIHTLTQPDTGITHEAPQVEPRLTGLGGDREYTFTELLSALQKQQKQQDQEEA